jgi:hypothetical protein
MREVYYESGASRSIFETFFHSNCFEPSLHLEKMKLSSFFSRMSHDLRQHATNFAASIGQKWAR